MIIQLEETKKWLFILAAQGEFSLAAIADYLHLLQLDLFSHPYLGLLSK